MTKPLKLSLAFVLILAITISLLVRIRPEASDRTVSADPGATAGPEATAGPAAATTTLSTGTSGRDSAPNPESTRSSVPNPSAPSTGGGGRIATVANVPRPAPGGAAPAAGKFDPRFVQPATRLKLFGPPPEVRDAEIRRLEAEDRREKAEAIAWARASGWPIRGLTADGSAFELMRLENGRPIYYQTCNREASISQNVAPLDGYTHPGITSYYATLRGNGWTVGMIEGRSPRLSHQEFTDYALDGTTSFAATYQDRINPPDPGNVNEDHATHVLGTLIGRGADSEGRARGMAPEAQALCYNWNGDVTKLRANGANAPGQPDRFYVSNHSYGRVAGWKNLTDAHPSTGETGWHWYGEGGETEDRSFGLYSADSRAFDRACWFNPYLLPFLAAGNDRDQGPGFFDDAWWRDANGDWVDTDVNYGTSGAPGANGNDGYDTIGTKSAAKNVMCIGNMEDAVDGGVRSIEGVEMVGSSSYGPADDGRIKPDLVANGHDVYSASRNTDTSYVEKTGTSMASPGAAGTGLLLHEHYRNRTGQHLRASTLKALMIHTATDLFTPGPDYKSGWGLVDGLAAAQQIDRHANAPGNSRIREDFLSPEVKEVRLTFTARPGERVRATLVWTDPAATTIDALDDRSKRLVNDLDLTLRLPDGSLRRAPELDPLNPENAATYNGNTTDNVEMVGGGGQAITGQTGLYELLISHKGTLSRTQVFSLILEGNANDETGTVAEAVDKPDHPILKSASADAGFAYRYHFGSVGTNRAVSMPTGHSQTAGFETTIEGPVAVSFDWGVSSETSYDFLRFYCGDEPVAEISGDQATTRYSCDLPAGSHTLRWAYEKDGSVDAGDDHGWIDYLSFDTLPDAVDNFTVRFTEPPGSSAAWSREALTGDNAVPTNDVALSGDIAGGQWSGMATTIQGPALVRFRMRQAGSGVLMTTWGQFSEGQIQHSAGDTWTDYSIVLEPGPQPICWSSSGTGKGRVDELEIEALPGSVREALNLAAGTDDFEQGDGLAPWVADSTTSAPGGRDEARDGLAVRSAFHPGAGTAANTTTLTHTILGPATISFWWQASGAPSGNLSLQKRRQGESEFTNASPATVGPRVLAPIPGGTPWRQVHLELPRGWTDLRFLYTPAPDGSEGVGWIDRFVVQEGAQHPARGLDRWGTQWQFKGDAPWHAIPDPTTGGLDSTTHGTLQHNQSTTLTATVAGPKRLHFRWKVSSEAGWDEFAFKIGDQDATPPISGEVAWTPVTVQIPAGNHVLRWIYTKDGTVTNGQDRGWVDSVSLLRPDFEIASIQRFGNAVRIDIKKDPTPGFFLEKSSDLVTWVPAFETNGGMLAASQTEPAYFLSAPGDREFYRVGFTPEIMHTIANSGFESPSLGQNGTSDGAFPGWTYDGANPSRILQRWGDPASTAYAVEGEQHLEVAWGGFTEMDEWIVGPRGVHSVTAAVASNTSHNGAPESDVVIISGGELARGENMPNLPYAEWIESWPASTDYFPANLNDSLLFKVRLESNNGYGHFDNVRVVTEPQ